MPAYRLLVTSDTVGGVWRYAVDLARQLAAADVAVTLAAMGPRASAEQRAEAEAVCDFIDTQLPLDWLCDDRGELASAGRGLARIAQQRGVDIVQTNGPILIEDRADWRAPIAAVHHSCLATWWHAVKGGPLPSDWEWRRELTQDYLNNAAAVAAPSRAFAEAAFSTYKLVRRPQVILNGRPTPPAERGPMRDCLLTAGRLWDDGKDIATLERAARKLDAPVYAAGPLRGPNGTQARLERVVHLGELGEREIRARFSERPLFVSSARYEPFGLAVLEAAQAGCPLLLSDIPTFRELWEGAALFFPCGDDSALTEAASALLADPDARAFFGGLARERACNYSLARSAQATLAWHLGLLSAEPRKEDAA